MNLTPEQKEYLNKILETASEPIYTIVMDALVGDSVEGYNKIRRLLSDELKYGNLHG